MPTITSLRRFVPIVALGALLSLAACSTGTPGATASTQAGAEAALCASIDAFGTSVQTLVNTDPATASIEDVQASRAAVGTAWDAVKAAAANIPEADEAALEAAFTGLAAAVDDAPTDQAIADVVASIKTAGAAIPAAITEMKDGAGCS